MSQEDDLILSATAVVLRDGSRGLEVLLLQRNKAIKVHGGSWVFPGGKVDAEDIPIDIKTGDHPLSNIKEIDKQRVTKIAACREAMEEAGLQLKPEQLHHCSRWITPDSMKKRFDAYFYLTQLDGEYTSIKIDDGEIEDYRWLSPVEALELNSANKLTLPPPTYLTLLKLSSFRQAGDAISQLTKKPTEYRPKLVLTNSGFHSIYQEDNHYESPSAELGQRQHRLILQNGKYHYIDKQ